MKFKYLYLQLPNKGGNQLTLASEWASRNTRTSAVAALAPANLALIRPCLEGRWITCTMWDRCFLTKSSRGFLVWAVKKDFFLLNLNSICTFIYIYMYSCIECVHKVWNRMGGVIRGTLVGAIRWKFFTGEQRGWQFYRDASYRCKWATIVHSECRRHL